MKFGGPGGSAKLALSFAGSCDGDDGDVDRDGDVVSSGGEEKMEDDATQMASAPVRAPLRSNPPATRH